MKGTSCGPEPFLIRVAKPLIQPHIPYALRSQRNSILNILQICFFRRFLSTVEEEAGKYGYRDVISFYYGNFVESSDDVPSSDIVTRDGVICCFDEMEDQFIIYNSDACS